MTVVTSSKYSTKLQVYGYDCKALEGAACRPLPAARPPCAPALCVPLAACRALGPGLLWLWLWF